MQPNLDGVRTSLRVQPLTDDLRRPWNRITLVPESPSTNADLARGARDGTVPLWSVLVAEHQSAGRGRLGRTWSTVPGAALTFSALVPTPAEPGWVPLLTGLAVADAVEDRYALRPSLKWPNDLLAPVGRGEVSGRKLSGILCELTGQGIVIGIGLNVDQSEGELPVPTATSLRQVAGKHPEGLTREALLLCVLERLAARLETWASDPDEVRAAYRRSCATLGREVQVDLGSEGVQRATAVAVDDEGRLVVECCGRQRALAAGDVTHVR